MTEKQSIAVAKIVEILRPFHDPNNTFYNYEGGCDTVGPDEDIRTIVKQALKELNLSDLGDCRLCLIADDYSED